MSWSDVCMKVFDICVRLYACDSYFNPILL
jgi:hypothetical protein